MEGHTEEIRVENNFEDLFIQLSDIIDEDQRGLITCSRSHLEYFLQGTFNHTGLYSCAFLRLLRGVKMSVFLHAANIHSHSFSSLILWLFPLILFSSFWKVIKKT